TARCNAESGSRFRDHRMVWPSPAEISAAAHTDYSTSEEAEKHSPSCSPEIVGQRLPQLGAEEWRSLLRSSGNQSQVQPRLALLPSQFCRKANPRSVEEGFLDPIHENHDSK